MYGIKTNFQTQTTQLKFCFKRDHFLIATSVNPQVSGLVEASRVGEAPDHEDLGGAGGVSRPEEEVGSLSSPLLAVARISSRLVQSVYLLLSLTDPLTVTVRPPLAGENDPTSSSSLETGGSTTPAPPRS